MKTILLPMLTTVVGLLQSRTVLHLEILALRQQLAMVTARDRKRPRFHQPERMFWVWSAGTGRDFASTGSGNPALAAAGAPLWRHKSEP